MLLRAWEIVFNICTPLKTSPGEVTMNIPINTFLGKDKQFLIRHHCFVDLTVLGMRGFLGQGYYDQAYHLPSLISLSPLVRQLDNTYPKLETLSSALLSFN